METLTEMAMSSWYARDLPIIKKALDDVNIEYREEFYYWDGLMFSSSGDVHYGSDLFVSSENRQRTLDILAQMVDGGVIS